MKHPDYKHISHHTFHEWQTNRWKIFRNTNWRQDKPRLVGGFFPPISKICNRQIGFHEPPIFGVSLGTPSKLRGRTTQVQNLETRLIGERGASRADIYGDCIIGMTRNGAWSWNQSLKGHLARNCKLALIDQRNLRSKISKTCWHASKVEVR